MHRNPLPRKPISRSGYVPRHSAKPSWKPRVETLCELALGAFYGAIVLLIFVVHLVQIGAL